MRRLIDNDASRSPRGRTSGSTLFAAFRNLTGGNGRPAASSPSTSTTIDSPVRESFSLLPGRTLDPDLAPITNGHLLRPASPSNGVTGGPPYLPSLLEKLRRGNEATARTRAAVEIASILKTYPVDNVMGIWSIARDMIEDEDTPETHTAGYALLYSCVKYKTLSPHERGFFFEAIPRAENPSTFNYRFKVLQAITEDARYLDSLESMIIPLLVRFLKQSWSEAVSARARKSNRQDRGAEEATRLNLKAIFTFIAEVIKFNSKLCPRKDFHLLLDELILICRRTLDASDIDRVLDIIDSIVIYAQLDAEYLRIYVEILCGTAHQVKDLREKAWKNASNLLTSHHGPATHAALLSILKEPNTTPASYPATRGALFIYSRILTSDDSHPLPQTSISKLVSACKKALTANELSVDSDILLLLHQLVQSLDTTSLILDETRWNTFADILESCAHKHPSHPRVAALKRVAGTGRTKELDPKTLASISQHLQNIANCLMARTSEMDYEQKSQVMNLFMRMVPQLDDSSATELITFYAQERLLLPSSDDWQSGCDLLLKSVFLDRDRSVSVRKMALKTLYDAYNTGEALGGNQVDQLIINIVGRIGEERDVEVVAALAEMCAGIAAWTTKESTFDEMVMCLQTALFDGFGGIDAQNKASEVSATARLVNASAEVADTASAHVANALVKIFLRSVSRYAWKTEKVYHVLLAIVASHNAPADARVVCLKLLFRLRADINHGVFVVPTTDCENIAAALCRTQETAASQTTQSDSPVLRPTNPEDNVARRPNPVTVNSTPVFGKTGNSAGRSSSGTKINRPMPPLWLYPGPKGLPEEPAKHASHVVFVQLPEKKSPLLPSVAPCTKLDMGQWLEALLKILQQPELEWEVYSYILVHLGAQLTNHALFNSASKHIQLLRSVVCGQLSNKNFHEPPAWTGLAKGDAAVCFYHILTMLLGYREHFSKNEADDVVKMFTLGMGAFERTPDVCIHALAVCCHELPLSITKSMVDILQRMSQIITRGSAAVNILEFLAGLARMPELYRNFREEEFKLVFGICFRYLQSVRDQAKGSGTNRHSISNLRLSSVGNDTSLAAERKPARSMLVEELPQYVYTLAFHVMTFWFISLKLSDRPKQVPWIKKQLLYTDRHGQEGLEEQSQVLIDLMERLSFSDRDETAPDREFATESDGPVATKNWLVGSSILTIETAGRSGVSQLTRRRPSNTRYSMFRPHIVNPPRHQVAITSGLEAEQYNTKDYVGIYPHDILQEFYAPQQMGSSPFAEAPIPLPDDDMTRRSISTFDRISPLDGHKCGIIYIGDGQASEQEILQNVMGSDDYTSFLGKIGTYTKLKGAEFNTQGLDREFDFDGVFTVAWRDRVTELVFHVTTLMPTDLEHDALCINKKRHIGNDHVNIIFNNSGDYFDIDTFPSDFGWIYIVITPEARASFVETRLASADHHSSTHSATENTKSTDGPWDDTFYRVTTMVKPGIPPISPAAATKMVSGASLASFVRLIALNASVFCKVWGNRASAGGSGEHVSSWRSRLREINRLRQRHAPEAPPSLSPSLSPRQLADDRLGSSSALAHLSTASMGPPALPYSSAGPTPASARDAGRESALFRRTSQANIFSLGAEAATHRHSAFGGSTDMERSSSAGSGPH